MTKADLLQYRALTLEVRRLRSFVAELESEKYSVPGSDFSGVPRGNSSNGSPIEKKVIRYLDAVALYEAKIAEKTAMLIAIEDAIETLDSPVERTILRLRYLEGHKWTSVCLKLEALGYSERQVYYLHGFALKKLEEVSVHD